MIDAAKFSVSFGAFWRSIAPASELVVRRLNLAAVVSFDFPMAASAGDLDAATIAETGFAAFALEANGSNVDRDQLMERAFKDAQLRMRHFSRDDASEEIALSGGDLASAVTIYNRLQLFFRQRAKPLRLRPVFQGCGFIDASEGDVISGDALFEVKAVERGFRSTDLFQLLTYYALSHHSRQYEIHSLGIVNPKRGMSVELDVDDLCRNLSGLDAREFSDEIGRAISSGEISR